MGEWQSGQLHLTVNQASLWLRWFESILTHQIAYAVCPGGEGAALKAVGLKGLAGSNPVDGAKWLSKFAFNSTVFLNVYCMKKKTAGILLISRRQSALKSQTKGVCVAWLLANSHFLRLLRYENSPRAIRGLE